MNASGKLKYLSNYSPNSRILFINLLKLFSLSFFLSMTGDPDVCTNRVENAVYVAAGNDPYELLEVRQKEFHVDNLALERIYL